MAMLMKLFKTERFRVSLRTIVELELFWPECGCNWIFVFIVSGDLVNVRKLILNKPSLSLEDIQTAFPMLGLPFIQADRRSRVQDLMSNLESIRYVCEGDLNIAAISAYCQRMLSAESTSNVAPGGTQHKLREIIVSFPRDSGPDSSVEVSDTYLYRRQ
jgi:hypothetical protein